MSPERLAELKQEWVPKKRMDSTGTIDLDESLQQVKDRMAELKPHPKRSSKANNKEDRARAVIFELIEGLETARATAFEEAAQWHDFREKEHRAAAVDGNGRLVAAAAHNASALVFRRDAGLPPKLVPVARDVMEELLSSLRRFHEAREQGTFVRLDHKLGENVEGCSGCGCAEEVSKVIGEKL